MDAQTSDAIVKALSVLGLVVLAFREILRTRKERIERHDTGRLARIQAEADAEKRRDELLRASLQQNAQYLEQIAHLAQAIQDNTTLESRRIEANERIFKSQNEALISLTEAQGEGAQRITDQTRVISSLDKGVVQLREKVSDVKATMLDQFGQTVTHVGGKIDTALSKAGEMLEKKVDPVQEVLNELRQSIEDIQTKLSHIEEEVGHIPGVEQCITETNRIVQELTVSTRQIVAERDSALNDVQSLRNALLFINHQKQTSETDLAHPKEMLVPPNTAALPSEGVPLPDRAEGAQPGGVA